MSLAHLCALALALTSFILFANPTDNKSEEIPMKKAHTVMVVVEAKPEKVEELKEALLSVVAPSRAESSCLEYRLHQDKNNPAQFMLYENWESDEAHQKQFEKPYIVELAGRMGDLLAKPYFVVMAEDISQ
jgi:quinol monooxygenase YgiN